MNREAALDGGRRRPCLVSRTSPLLEHWFRLSLSLSQWLGDTLRNWIDENGKEATIKLTYTIADDEFEALRLNNVGRYIIRGMMKKIMKLHQQGRAHCSLNPFTIFVDDKYDVQLSNNQYRPASQKNIREDCVALKIIVKAILGKNIPDDVSHLLHLLDNYSRHYCIH